LIVKRIFQGNFEKIGNQQGRKPGDRGQMHPLDNPPAWLYIETMTGWDVLNNIINGFPPVALALLLVAAVAAAIIFVIGFARHGVNFIKYGFKQTVLDSALEKHFDKLEAKFDARFAKIDARIAAIEINHFGHLKDFLTELTSVLLDKGVINNQDKARLDNKLRGM
jgi:hypothetical protein